MSVWDLELRSEPLFLRGNMTMENTRREFIKTIGETAVAASIAAETGAAQATSGAKPKTPEIGKATSADFYVSPDGNDSDTGTLAKPFQSLARARDAVFQLRKARRVQKPVVVMLRGGTYRLEQSVVFSGRDSGTEQSPVTYMAYPGKSSVLSGGRPVRG